MLTAYRLEASAGIYGRHDDGMRSISAAPLATAECPHLPLVSVSSADVRSDHDTALS